MLDSALAMKDLTDQERLLFQHEFLQREKNSTTGVVLALFLGNFGAHHFYLNQIGLGVLYALMSWSLIPGLIALIECFLIPDRVKLHNTSVAESIVIKIKAIRTTASATAGDPRRSPPRRDEGTKRESETGPRTQSPMSDPPQQSEPGARASDDRFRIEPVWRRKARHASPRTAPPPEAPTAGTEAGSGESDERIEIAPIARTKGQHSTVPAPTGESHTEVQPWQLATVAGAAVAAILSLVLLCSRETPPGDESREMAPPPSWTRLAPEKIPHDAPPPPSPGIRQEAVQLLSAFQKLAATLAPHAERWAGERYRTARALVGEGEQALLGGDVNVAATRFREGLAILRQLDEERPQVLADALQGGVAALGRGDKALARQRFELAVAIDPDNPRANRGLERAKKLGEVLEATSAGAAREGEGDWSGARDAYAKALELDPEWEPAREGRRRVASRLRTIRFEQHLAAGTRAFEAGRWEAARKSLRAALALRGASEEAQDALRRVEGKILEASLTRSRDLALGSEEREDWTGAVGHYEAALALDAQSSWAQDGLARGRRRLELDQQIRRTLEDPARLYRDATALAEAQKLAAAIAQVQNPGPRLGAQREKLQESIERALTPIAIQFVSDNQTEVTIVQVHRLGTFDRLEFALRPGTYVVTGWRRGYRDVRKTITVAPNDQALSFEIRCNEAI